MKLATIFVSSVQKELAEERARYIKKAGTGTLDMIARCRQAGLAEPQFQQRGGQFIQALRRPVAESASEVTPEVTQEVTPEVLLARALVGEMTRQSLQQALGLKDEEHFRRSYLQPALDAGLVEMTIPSKPRSSRQSYRLTLMDVEVARKREGA